MLNGKKIGISMIGQTMNLAPADKKLYALRDTISCVESIPLIASSIMSKKIASGAEKIVLDVTVGHGAFMKNMQDAEKKQILGAGIFSQIVHLSSAAVRGYCKLCKCARCGKITSRDKQ